MDWCRCKNPRQQLQQPEGKAMAWLVVANQQLQLQQLLKLLMVVELQQLLQLLLKAKVTVLVL
jgi:hypothetical protein